MSSRPIPLYAGRFYHVYNRGNHRQQVFKQPEDYLSFLEKWKKYLLPIADTWAYTMLPNHFHSVLRIHDDVPAKQIEQTFSNFFNSFARVLQNRHGYTGALFQRPFRRKEITTDDQLRWEIGYVLTNITHHNPTKDYRCFEWSSYRATIADKPTLIPRERLHQLFGGKEALLEFLQNQAGYYGRTED